MILLEYKLWDYKIFLQEGKSLIYKSIYTLNQIEMEKLRKYIEVNQKKGFIRLSLLLVGYSILFILKKDGMLWLCVDYC